MADMKILPSGNLDPVQAAELAVVVDLEARWENMRTTPQIHDAPPTIQNLQGKQKAYEAFRAKLTAYNKRYQPAHVPEMLLNTSIRLGLWCRAMRKLYARLEHESQAQSPVHVLEKAYRWADVVAGKEKRVRMARSAAPESISAAIRDLDALALWCEDMVRMAPAA